MGFLRKGFVQAVTGNLEGDSLGAVLTHEHIHMQFDVAFTKPPKEVPYPKDGPEAFYLPNLGALRQYPYGTTYNLKLDDEDTNAIILDELIRYKNLGGGTIVENTTHGISRNVKKMKKLSLLSGVNIICGAGYYVAGAQTLVPLTTPLEALHDSILNDITNGIPDDDNIKCGVIGEIGISWPMHGFERNVIRAVAMVQEATNAPVTFHPGRNPESPFEIIRVFTEAGGKAEDVVMSHLDRTFFDEEQLLEFAKLKTFTQYDLFGTECSYYQLQEEIDFLSDAQRILKLKLLKEAGHLDQILMSHDIHTKHRLANFGGHGYGHILQNIVPKMKKRGFNDQDLDTILIQNPKRWLCG